MSMNRRTKLRLTAAFGPLIAHVAVAAIVGPDVDGGGALFFAAILAGGLIGWALGMAGFDPFTATLAAAWPPAAMVALGLYGAMNIHSAGGSAQEFVGGYGWRYAPAVPATAAVVSVFALPSALVGRAMRAFELWHLRRFGRPFFEVDE